MPETPLAISEPSLADGDIGVKKAPRLPFPRLERLSIAAAVAFQVLVLVVMIAGNTVPFFGAKAVLLKVAPVDPRDLFRGDYVILSYDINRIPYGQFQAGDPVYATLIPERDGRRYRVGAMTKTEPLGSLFIQGTAESNGRATYGIESFYVQEGKGHDYEDAVRTGNLWAEIALDHEGHPAIKRLVVE